MTKDEALKLALEALEDPSILNGMNNAKFLIKQALEQPEEKPFTYYDPVRDAIRPFKSDGDIPLFTTPQKREWVGLTDVETAKCFEARIISDRLKADAARIEAKLKELNT